MRINSVANSLLPWLRGETENEEEEVIIYADRVT